ncbi:MAG TPA: DUF1176 domain-containing protein [Mesorhizobium sp.]
MRTGPFTAILFCAPALLAAAPAFCAEPPYLDDRSSAETVLKSLYNAVSRHEYARAWDYFGETKPATDFDVFVKGFEGTDHVDVTTGGETSEGAAGSIYFTVPVAIRAVGGDGTEKIFSGCYTLRQVNGQIQSPPFNPIHIEKGELKPATGAFEASVPASCGDGPPPPKKDAVLEQAKAMFAAAYGSQCDPTLPGGEAVGVPEEHVIHYTAGGDSGEKAARLFRFFCSTGAYNENAVYYLSTATDTLRQLQFATPELDIRYENDDNQGKVEAVNIIGFQTDERLVNSSYDDTTKSIVSHNRWRGVGDAGTSGTWLFRDGQFSLVQFDVDASYDGQSNPETVLDYNTAP